MVQTGVQEQNWVIDLLFRVFVSSGFVPAYLKTNRAFVTKLKKKNFGNF